MRLLRGQGRGWGRGLADGRDTRLAGLLIGALAARVLASLPSLDVLRRRAFRVVVVAAALTLVTVLHSGRAAAPPMYFGVGSLVSLCAALVLIGTFAADTWIGSLLEFGPLVWIGRISYGLYLWHYPVIACVFENHRLARLGVDPAWWIPIQIAASLAVATGSFYLLERPMLRFKQRFGSRVSGGPEGVGTALAEPRSRYRTSPA